MEIKQNGFIVSLLIIIIVVLVAGFALYIYKDKGIAIVPAENNLITNQETSSPQPKVLETSEPKVLNTPVVALVDNSKLDESEIINTLNAAYNINLQKNSNGDYQSRFLNNKDSNVSVDSITLGDLNNDRFTDAIVHVTVCGASCGSQFDAILNGSVVSDVRLIPDFTTVGAAQVSVKNITINQGIISIKYISPNRGDGSPEVEQIANYKLSSKNLVRIN